MNAPREFDANPTYARYGFFEGTYDFDFGLWQPRGEEGRHPNRKQWMQRNALPMMQGLPEAVDERLGDIKRPFKHINDVVQIANQFYNGQSDPDDGKLPDGYMMMFQRIGRTMDSQYVQHDLVVKVLRDSINLQPVSESPLYSAAVDTWRRVQERGVKIGNAIIANKIIVTGYEAIRPSRFARMMGDTVNKPVITDLEPIDEKLAQAVFHTLAKWPSNPNQ